MSRARELAKVGGKNQQVIAGLSSHVGVSTFAADVSMFGDLSVLGDLAVTGDLSYDEVTASNQRITGISTLTFLKATTVNVSAGLTAASAQISDLTSGRVVIAGTGGELQDNSALTFSGGTLSATTFSGNLPTSDLTGTITNAQLAGNIANSKLVNDSVSFGGVSVDLGASDATPAFDLQDATNLPTTSLTGTITNAQLAGSIANSKLTNDSVSFGGVSVDLGSSDATPAFNLADATGLPISTGVAGLANNVATFLATPSSSNLRSVVTDETGSGALVFGTSPTIATPDVTGRATMDDITLSGGVVVGAGLTVSGNLVVNGTTTTINSTTISVDDKHLELGATSSPSDTSANGGGIILKGDSDHTILWQNDNDQWEFSENINLVSGKTFQIADTSVLSATTLGSGVVNSSLTSVGTIASGVWQGTAIANAYLANSTVSFGGISLALGASDATPAFDLSDATDYPTSSLVGTITNAQLAGSIANSKLSNSTVGVVAGNGLSGGGTASLGGSVSLAINVDDSSIQLSSDELSVKSLGITNAMLAGSIVNSKLANNSVSYGGVELALGASDLTPAFNLADATNYPTSSLVGTITNAQLAGSIAASKLAGSIGNSLLSNSSISLGGVSVSLGGSNATPAFDLSDATDYPTSSLVGTITNAQLAGGIAASKLAGSIGNSLLSNSSVSYGGVSLALGASDATPAFDLSDATDYPTSSLVGTITNAQLAGSIAASKLAGGIGNSLLSNSSISLGGVSVSLGGSDATPAFDLSDATNYPTSSLSGTITNAQLAGSIANSKLATSGVSAGAYGSSSAIPIITVNNRGIVTSASTTAIDTTSIADGDTSVTASDAGSSGSTVDVTIDNSIVSSFLGSGFDVTGNITVSGTVDGRDVASDGSKLDGIESGADVTDATNVNAAGAVMNSDTSTAAMSFVTDQDNMSGNSATKVPTQQSVKAYVDTSINNLVNGAPGALDTLNELAAALGDDSDFSTTITSSIATKLPLAGGTMTGNIVMSGSQTVDGRDLSVDGAKLDGIESGATADQSAAEILALIKTVDGSGSGLDADTLDGVSSGSFLRSDTGDTKTSGNLTFNDDVKARFGSGGDLHVYHDGSNSILHNDTGNLKVEIDSSNNSDIQILNNNTTTISNHSFSYSAKFISGGSVELYEAGTKKFETTSSGVSVSGNIAVSGTVDGRDVATDGSKLDGIESGATADQTASEILTLLKTVDGSGSGLDADTLDGISSGNFLRSNTSDTFSGTLTMSGNIIPNANGTRDLGSSSTRWANVYSSDLDLSNEAKGPNSIDGTWGSYLIEEGEEHLYITNRRSGKKFRFLMEEV